MNYENVKDALKELVALNTPGTTFELKDLQESNYELLANVCDLLGMSEIYLDDWGLGYE